MRRGKPKTAKILPLKIVFLEYSDGTVWKATPFLASVESHARLCCEGAANRAGEAPRRPLGDERTAREAQWLWTFYSTA